MPALASTFGNVKWSTDEHRDMSAGSKALTMLLAKITVVVLLPSKPSMKRNSWDTICDRHPHAMMGRLRQERRTAYPLIDVVRGQR